MRLNLGFRDREMERESRIVEFFRLKKHKKAEQTNNEY